MKLDIPFAYRVREGDLRSRGARDGDHFRRSTVRIDLPEVKRSDLFLAFRCQGSTQSGPISRSGFSGYEADYRVYDGQLVRPVISSVGAPMTAADFVALTARRAIPADTGLSFWAENPFMTNPRRHREWMYACLAEPETRSERDAHEESRTARLLELSDTLNGCVVADGILYRPTIEPVWGVSMFNGSLSAELSMDADASRPTLAFKVDDPSFPDFCAEYRRLTGWKVFVMSELVMPDIVRFDHLRLPAEDLLVGGIFSDIGRTMDEFEGRLRGHSKEAYDSIRAAEADLNRTVWSGDAIEEHLGAFRRIGDMFEHADLDGLSKAAVKRFQKAREIVPVTMAAAAALELDTKAGYGM